MENNHFDELLYSLPDYITGELDDDTIKEQIEAKLLIDSSFREEYDSLKATLNFIEETELEPPSEVYFANLQANILSKVHKENAPEKESILAKLVGYWKVVVPALTVCVVLVIYTNNMDTPKLPLTEEVKVQMPAGNNVIKNNDAQRKEETALQENTVQSENKVSPVETDFNISRHKRSESFFPSETSSADESTASLGEEPEGGIIFGNDDMQAQDEYNNLSADDQLDILQSLKDKKL